MSIAPRAVLITGANRGLGLEFVKQIVCFATPPKYLFATCRNPDTATSLQEVATSHSCVKVMKLDVCDFNSFNNLKENISSMLEGEGLNFIVCNAAIHLRSGFADTTPELMTSVYTTNVVAPVTLAQVKRPHCKSDVTRLDEIQGVYDVTRRVLAEEGLNLLVNNAGIAYKKQYLGNITNSDMLEQFTVNVFSPLLIAQTFVPLLKLAAQKSSEKGMSWHKAALVNMSSILGSVESNQSGGLYPYRASKAALNMVTKNQSIDLKTDEILAVAVHPGWVRTDMGGQAAPVSPTESVQGMLNVFSSMSEETNGTLVDFTGTVLPW